MTLSDISVVGTTASWSSVSYKTYISLNGGSYSETTQTSYTPTTEGTHSGTVILTSGVYTDTIVLNGTVVVDNPTLEATPNTMTFTGTVGEATAAQTTTIPLCHNFSAPFIIGS